VNVGEAMRKMMIAFVVLALAAAACGDDGAADTVPAGAPLEVSSTTEAPLGPAAADEVEGEMAVEQEGTVPDPEQDPGPVELEPAPTKESTPPPTLPPQPVEEPPSGSSPAETAVADLAVRLGVDAGSISVVSAEEVTWPDRSLGCPQPDMLYAQVLTNGSRIVLEHDGTRYAYHSGAGRGPFYCAAPSAPVPGYGDT
jgi:hypothetical protein